MTARLTLHIGHFKTGTTALQVFFDRHRPRLARQGLVYATSALHLSKHSELAFSLLAEAGVTRLMHGYSPKTPAARLWAQLADEARRQPDASDLLVSSEEFMRLGAYPAAIEGLRAQLVAMRDIQVRAIAYLRPPQEHLLSWYNQLVKMHAAPGDFDATVALMEPVHTDFSAAILPWVRLLGAHRVILRGYTPDLRKGNALAQDMLAALGYRLPVWPKPPGKDPNPRLDPRSLDLRRALGRHGVPSAVVERMVGRLVSRLPALTPADPDLRDRAARGLDALHDLPDASIDWDWMRADLPRASPDDLRQTRLLVDQLCAEVVRLRRRRKVQT